MPAPRHETPRPQPETILRLPVVVERTGRSRSAIYADIARGEFPQPLRLGPRAVGWRESDIRAWLDSRAVGVLEPPPAATARRRTAQDAA